MLNREELSWIEIYSRRSTHKFKSFGNYEIPELPWRPQD